MKVSVNWLRELVELPPTVDELVHLLTMAGVEVEGVETRGVALDQVVVARILQSVPHPNADRLSVCQVDDGSGIPRQIVCGAKNYQVGDQVPLALPGAVLPGDFKIKIGKLRGEESQGMLCSSTELGLPKGEDGLLILQTDAPPGTPISTLFPGDTILDLEITPNRPDLLCMWGVACEIGILSSHEVALPHFPKHEPTEDSPFEVTLAGSSRCLYSAARLSGVKIGPSPDWLRSKLESLGLRSINNAVDVTNFVLMSSGQPAHVFDAAKVRGHLQVRLAAPAEELRALDGKTYILTADDLVIADDVKALAIAGVMGGEESSVTAATTDVILEIANFEPRRIRRTSRRLGLSSDSSYRFERGVSLVNTRNMAGVALGYLAEVTGAKLVHRAAWACEPAGLHSDIIKPRAAIPLRKARVEKLLGIEVSEERIDEILRRIGLQKMDGGWSPPEMRPDLTREVDLIEEIARVIGMEVIPAKVQARFAEASAADRADDFSRQIRRALTAQGFHEARSLTLIAAQPLGRPSEPGQLRQVKNPMIDDQVVLRPHLLHGLLSALRDNLQAGARSIRLFEIGRVFAAAAPEERTHLGIILSGEDRTPNWRGEKGRELDLFDLKGAVQNLLPRAVTFAPTADANLALALAIKVQGTLVGMAGQLWPVAARALGAPAPVLFAEINLADFAAATSGTAATFREIARFPTVTRDVALLVPLTLTHEKIAAVLAAGQEPLLERVELFDIFTDATGQKVAADQKSLAYSLTYRAADRTLTTSEVETAHGRLKERLRSELSVSFRE